MRNKSNASPVVQLLDHVWLNTNSAVSHSYDRINRAMRNALELAIVAGFKFVEDDITTGLVGRPSGSMQTRSIPTRLIANLPDFAVELGFGSFVARDVLLASSGKSGECNET